MSLCSGDQQEDEPIYAGSSVTLLQCLILLLTFATRHALTNEAISDLLSLLRLLCPFPSLNPNSLWLFRRLISTSYKPEYHYVCQHCLDNLPGASSPFYPTCHKTVPASPKYFTTLCIRSQLASMFKRKNMCLHMHWNTCYVI